MCPRASRRTCYRARARAQNPQLEGPCRGGRWSGRAGTRGTHCPPVTRNGPASGTKGLTPRVFVYQLKVILLTPNRKVGGEEQIRTLQVAVDDARRTGVQVLHAPSNVGQHTHGERRGRRLAALSQRQLGKASRHLEKQPDRRSCQSRGTGAVTWRGGGHVARGGRVVSRATRRTQPCLSHM